MALGRGRGQGGQTGEGRADFTVAFGHGHPLVLRMRDLFINSYQQCYLTPKFR